jgi:hypothetical protein
VSQYGALPKPLGIHQADCREFMFYQYLPVKLAGATSLAVEPRLKCFENILGVVSCDYVGFRGLDAFVAAHVYMTAKCMVTAPGAPMNRPGWHSDGFLTDDINYIWSDCLSTVFNHSRFELTLDDQASLEEMAEQADPWNDMSHEAGTLLRLDQFCIHRVAQAHMPIVRTFLKVSFSPDRYDLIGNSHNFLIDYNWPMRERGIARNVPQHVTVSEKQT